MLVMCAILVALLFFFSSRRRHTRCALVTGVQTCALPISVAAVAGVAVMLREWALKAKRRTMLTRRLPSVADAERLQVQLLIAAETVLGLGIVSGMAVQYFTTGMPLAQIGRAHV